MDRVSSRVAGLCLLTALSATPVIAAQRAFVASYGSDANTATLCSLEAPCRSFMAAIGVVDAGGEVVALDAAGYGSNISISKPLTLTANPGFHASISAVAYRGPAISIATSGKVILRQLEIRGVRGPGGDRQGAGISGGADVDVEHCAVSTFGTGISVTGNLRVSGTVIRDANTGIMVFGEDRQIRVDIADSQIVSNSEGIHVRNYRYPGVPTAGNAKISIGDSELSGNGRGLSTLSVNSVGAIRIGITRTIVSNNLGTGIQIATGPAWAGPLGDVRATIGASHIAGNEVGFEATEGAHFESMGDNSFAGNETDAVGIVILVPGT